MRHHPIRRLALGLLLLGVLASCEQELPLYSDGQARLNFEYEDAKDSTLNYSFIYHNGGDRDTVWLLLRTQGFLSDTDRPYGLEQVLTGENDAQPGVHYVPFDDPAYRDQFVVKAGAVTDSVPVIVLRDASLASQTVRLKVTFKETDTFKRGYADRSIKLITISDQIVKPNRWSGLMDFLFGAYGTEKHRFMIEHSGFTWDDEYLKSIGVSAYHADAEVQSFLRYMGSKFARELKALNAQRAAQGLQPLAEQDGTFVSFGSYN